MLTENKIHKGINVKLYQLCHWCTIVLFWTQLYQKWYNCTNIIFPGTNHKKYLSTVINHFRLSSLRKKYPTRKTLLSFSRRICMYICIYPAVSLGPGSPKSLCTSPATTELVQMSRFVSLQQKYEVARDNDCSDFVCTLSILYQKA